MYVVSVLYVLCRSIGRQHMRTHEDMPHICISYSLAYSVYVQEVLGWLRCFNDFRTMVAGVPSSRDLLQSQLCGVCASIVSPFHCDRYVRLHEQVVCACINGEKKIKIKTKSDRKTRTKTNVQRELYVRQRSEEKAVLNSNSGSSSSPAIGGQAKQTT